MRYKMGDIMLSYQRRIIYKLNDKPLIYDVIASPIESAIFIKEFVSKGITIATFKTFKLKCPEFNAKAYRNKSYGTIQITESMYLHLRELKGRAAYSRGDYQTIISDVIAKQFIVRSLDYNRDAKKHSIENLSKMKAMIDEMLNNLL